MMLENEKSEKSKELDKVKPTDFEEAMNKAGFGTYHILLLSVSVLATFGNVFESTTMSYILPVAECDLQLTLRSKGVLNAVTYGGMISSAIIWGYLADTQGRKKILVYGYLLDAVCVFGSALSQDFTAIVIFKFFGGFIVNGPGAILFTYVTEMHGSEHRARVIMILGIITTFATLILPLLSWAIFPQKWDFSLYNLKIHSWNIYLMICGIPSLLAGLAIAFLPESPRFLMSQGRNAEALRVFQKIYAINTRQSADNYPVKELIEEVPNRNGNANEIVYTIENKPIKQKRERRTIAQSLRDGGKQMQPLFRKPFLGHSIHVYAMQLCILMSLNTIRLWLPQLFASIAEYELKTGGNDSANLCTILEYSVNKTAEVQTSECNVNNNFSLKMYMNNIIVGVFGVVGYFAASFFIKAIGEKRMIVITLLISSGLGFSLYWSNNGVTTLIISSLFLAISAIATSSLMGVAIVLFPTSLRSLIMCVTMMCGRLGGLSGNLLFPLLVESGCLPPFLMVGLAMLCATILSVLLPNSRKNDLT